MRGWATPLQQAATAGAEPLVLRARFQEHDGEKELQLSVEQVTHAQKRV